MTFTPPGTWSALVVDRARGDSDPDELGQWNPQLLAVDGWMETTRPSLIPMHFSEKHGEYIPIHDPANPFVVLWVGRSEAAADAMVRVRAELVAERDALRIARIEEPPSVVYTEPSGGWIGSRS